MPGEQLIVVLVSIGLLLGSALFVAAEYGLIGSRRSRIESLAKQGNRTAQKLLGSYQDLPGQIAVIQIGITMIGVGLGAITEPLITSWLNSLLGDWAGGGLSVLVSLVIVTYFVVVVGELVPKYATLRAPERVALFLFRPVAFLGLLLKPLVWLVKRSGALVLRPFGISMDAAETESISKEELMLLVRSSGADVFELEHAQVVSRALRLDQLSADDVMIHRLDIQWVDLNTPREELLERLGRTSHSRVPVCREDIDDVVGVLYLQDVVKHWASPDFALERIMRPVVAIPENLPLNKVVAQMRDSKTQLLIVLDEYGGTSGLITLEDVVEEVFGELEDQLESERPPIELVSANRVSARGEVRCDELIRFLGLEDEGDTDTLAQKLVEGLGRVPKLGDTVDFPLGKLRVENMARRRITRVSVMLQAPVERPS